MTRTRLSRRASTTEARKVVLGLVAAVALAGCDTLFGNSKREMSFVQERVQHETRLLREEKAPTNWDPIQPVEWLEVFDYESDGRALRGYKAYPKNESRMRHGKFPLLFYLHGSFAIARQDIKDLIELLRDGFAVYAPAYRGENGQPGNWELWYGELDDARAALHVAAKDPRIDRDRIFVFGHSAGGVLASLMTFYPDLPIRDTGSAGGIYNGFVFESLDFPFEDTERERRLRLFLPNMQQMKKPHFACVGKEDNAWDTTKVGENIAKQEELPYQVHEVPGGHVGSLAPCLRAFHARIAEQS